MKTKSSVNVSVLGDVRELCGSLSEIYPKPKLIVCVDIRRIVRSLIQEGIIPINRTKAVSPETVKSWEFFISKDNKTIKIGDINTECQTISEGALEDLLLLRMYAEGTVTVSY